MINYYDKHNYIKHYDRTSYGRYYLHDRNNANNKPLSSSDYQQIMMRTIGIMTLGVVAYRMGGPTGKLIDEIKEDYIKEKVLYQKVMSANKSSIDKSNNPTIKTYDDVTTKIKYGNNISSLHALPTNEILTSMDDGTITSQSLINDIKMLETEVGNSFNKGQARLDYLHQKAGAKYSPGDIFSAKIQPNDATYAFVRNFRFEHLKYYMITSYSGQDLPQDISDIFDTGKEGLDGTFTKYSDMRKIDEVHEYLLRNDTDYAKSYHVQFKKEHNKLNSKRAAKLLSNPNLLDQANKLEGSVQELYDMVSKDFTIELPNINDSIFEATYELAPDGGIVEKQKILNLNDMNLTSHDRINYSKELKAISEELTKLKQSYDKDIESVFIKKSIYAGNENYFDIGIKLFNGKTDITHVPIQQNGMIPSPTVPGKSQRIASKFVGSSEVTNTTTMLLRSVRTSLASSMTNRLIDSSELATEQGPISRATKRIAQQFPTKSRDGRFISQIDTFQYQALHQLQRQYSSGITKTSKIKQGIAQFKLLSTVRKKTGNSKKYGYIVFDAEILNPSRSAEVIATDQFNEFWQYSISVFDHSGKNLSVKQKASDHVLYHGTNKLAFIKQDPQFAKTLLEPTNTEGAALRQYAAYSKKVFDIQQYAPPGSSQIEWDYQALLKQIDLIEDLSGISEYKGKHNPIKSSNQFSNLAIKELESEAERLRKQGITPILVTHNGTDFDVTVLRTLSGNSNALKNIDVIDTQRIGMMLNIGETSSTAMNLDALLNHYMDIYNKNKMGPTLISPDDPRGFVESLSKPNAILGTGYVEKFKQFRDQLEKKGKYRISSHNSAAYDNLKTLVLVELIDKTQGQHSEEILRTLNEHFKITAPKDTASRLLGYQGLEGQLRDGIHLSQSALSTNSATKGMFAPHIAIFDPFIAKNPLHRDLGQIFRGDDAIIRKGSSSKLSPNIRAEHLIRSAYTMKNDTVSHTTATSSATYITNRLNANMIFYFVPGSTEAHGFMSQDLADSLTLRNVRNISMNDVPVDSKLAHVVNDMYLDIQKKALRIAKHRKVDLNQGGSIVAEIFELAANIVARQHERHGTQPIINPDGKKSTVFMNEGGKHVNLKFNHLTKLYGLSFKYGSFDNGAVEIVANIGEEASGKGLQKAILNVGQSGKTNLHVIDAKSAQIAGGKDFGMFGTADFFTKGFLGTYQKLLLGNMLSLSGKLANDEKLPHLKREEAKETHRKVINHLKSILPIHGGEPGKPITIDYDVTADPKDILKAASNLKFRELLTYTSMVGDDAIYNKQRLEDYYYVAGGGDIWAGKDRINKDIQVGLNKLIKSYSDSSDQAAETMISDHRFLLERFDPLSMIERDLMEKNKHNKGFDFKNYYGSLTEGQKDDLIKSYRLPVVAEAIRDVNNTDISRIGFKARGVDFTLYGAFAGTESANIKHRVKVDKFDMSMLLSDSSMFTERFKNILRSNKRNKPNKAKDIIKTYSRVQRGLVDLIISDKLTEQPLSIDEINAFITNDKSIQKLTKEIDQIVKSTPNQKSINLENAIKSLQRLISNQELLTNDIDNANIIKDHRKLNKAQKLEELSKRILHASKPGQASLHISQLNEISRIAKEHGNLLTLKPFDEPIVMPLDDLVSAVNERLGANDAPLSAGHIIGLHNKVKQGQSIQQTKATKGLFRVFEQDNKTFISVGQMILPGFGNMQNIISNLEKEGTMFSSVNQRLKLTMDTMTIYGKYLDETGGNKELLGKELLKSFIKTLHLGLDHSKNSEWFTATEKVDPAGIMARYHSYDNIVQKANALKSQLNTGQHSSELRKFLSNHSQHGYNQKLLGEALDQIINIKANTVMANSNLVLGDDTMMHGLTNLKDGIELTFANMWDKMDTDTKLEYEKARRTLRTLPGGALFRNPKATGGSGGGGMLANYLPIHESIAQLLPMDDQKLYGYESLTRALLGGADTDGDLTEMIISGFTTINQLQEEQKLQDVSFKQFMQRNNQLLGHLNDTNDATRTIIRQVTKSGKTTFEQGIVDTNPSSPTFLQTVYRHISEEEVMSPFFDGKNPDLAVLAKVVDSTWQRSASLGVSDKALKDHMNTIVLSNYSKNIIGQWTNTMKTRIADILSANPNMDTQAKMELIGNYKVGMTAIMQDPISLGKHGVFEKAYEMAEILDVWKNPANQSKEQISKARKAWVSTYQKYAPDDVKLIADAERYFDQAIDTLTTVDLGRRKDPSLGEYAKRKANIVLGRANGSNIFTAATLSFEEQHLVDLNINSAAAEILSHLHSNTYKQISSSSSAHAEYMNELLHTVHRQHREQLLDDPIDIALKGKYSKYIPTIKGAGKTAAAIGAIYLAANFFRPNQLSDSGNPLDAYIDLGGGISGSGNTKIGLDNMINNKLDMVYMSHNNSATVELDSIDLIERQNRSRLNNKLLTRNASRRNRRGMEYFHNSGNYSSYRNNMTNYSGFRTNDMQRKVNMI